MIHVWDHGILWKKVQGGSSVKKKLEMDDGSYSHLVVGGDSIPLTCHSALRQYRAGLAGIPA
jgi:hypothetical protein